MAYDRIDLRKDPGGRWALVVGGLGLLVAAVDLARAPLPLGLAAVAVAVTLCDRGAPWWTRAATAVVGWALLTGFGYHQYGELTFTAADVARLGLLLACAGPLAAMLRPRVTTPQPLTHRAASMV